VPIERIKWDFQNIPYGPDMSQRFDMACKKKDVHAIVYIHGGAYFTGNRAQYPSFLADYIGSSLFATMDYRVLGCPPAWMAGDMVNAENHIHMGDILSDVDAALVKITGLSKENGIAIKDFILVGHSAGGHIALLYGYRNYQQNENIKIAACVSLAGPTDFTDDTGWSSMGMWGKDLNERLTFLSWMGTRLTDYKRLTGTSMELTQYNWTKQRNYSAYRKHIEGISPVSYVSRMERVPPTLMVHARSDDQVPYSNPLRLKAILDNTSTPHKLITTSGLANTHMLGGESYSENSPIVFVNQTWVKQAKEWLETYLG